MRHVLIIMTYCVTKWLVEMDFHKIQFWRTVLNKTRAPLHPAGLTRTFQVLVQHCDFCQMCSISLIPNNLCHWDLSFRDMSFLFSVGTTWMQEIVPLIHSEGDLTPVHTIPNWDRVPWLEEHRAKILNLEQRPSPRVFATHFHYGMMNKSYFKVKPKVLAYTFPIIFWLIW